MNILYKASLNFAGVCAVMASVLFNLCFRLLGQVVLSAIHLIYTWYLVIRRHCTSYRYVRRLLRTRWKTDIEELSVIKSRVPSLQKLPNHLAIVIGVESTSYKDLVKLIVWSLQAGIKHISFYDHCNGLDCQELFKYVCRDAKQCIPFVKWGMSFTDDIKNVSKTQINGYSWKPVISVHIFQRDDGVNMFLKSVPEIIDSGIESVDTKALDTFLRKYFNAPDPDLALVCGDILSYFGFPPWCLRVTQFQQLTTHHNLTVEAFLEQLEDYSACNQRWGT